MFFSGLSDDALSQIPSDIELLRFSTNCVSNQMHELVSYLEMSKKWDSITHNYPNDIEVAKYLVLSKWKEIKDQSNFKALAEALTKMDISTHFLCQVSLYYLNIKICFPLCVLHDNISSFRYI